MHIGWTCDSAVLRLQALLSGVGLKRLNAVGASRLRNHFEGSWVWRDGSVTLTPIDSLGEYRTYRLTPNPRVNAGGRVLPTSAPLRERRSAMH